MESFRMFVKESCILAQGSHLQPALLGPAGRTWLPLPTRWRQMHFPQRWRSCSPLWWGVSEHPPMKYVLGDDHLAMPIMALAAWKFHRSLSKGCGRRLELRGAEILCGDGADAHLWCRLPVLLGQGKEWRIIFSVDFLFSAWLQFLMAEKPCNLLK